MSFKFQKPQFLTLGIRAKEDRSFDEIIKIPSDSDTDSTQNFISLTDVFYNKSTHTEITDVLDGDGKCSFEINFYVDMEMANRANVRKVRFHVYTSDPTRRVTTTIDSRVGTRQYFNERFLVTMNKTSKSVGGKGYGKMASKSPNNLIDKTAKKKETSSLQQLNDGRIKTFEASLKVSDKTVNEIRKADRQLVTEPRLTIDRSSIAKALTVTNSSQVYSALVAPKVNINNNAVNPAPGQVAGVFVSGQNNSLDPRLATSFGTSIQESEQYLARQALLTQKSDPTSHLNCFYVGGPTSSGGSSKNPIQYTGNQTAVKNEVDESTSGKIVSSGMANVGSVSRQNATTQKAANFSGNPYMESLYQKSAQISNNTVVKSGISIVPIRQIVFESTLRQHNVKFDLDFPSLRPNQISKIYVMMELLDRDDAVFKSKLVNFDFRNQLKGILTPVTPPKVRVTSQSAGKIDLELEQLDPLATDISLFRMVARPDGLEEAKWTKIADIRANSRKGTVKFTDTTVSGNVQPNIVLYEASCSGLFGSACSATTKIVENGVKRITNLAKAPQIGECSIIATQKGSKVEIRVGKLPFGVTRVFLRRQLLNAANAEQNYRYHTLIRTLGSGQDFYNVGNTSSEYVFEDTAVINRQQYRYYAQLDWQDRERTNSITDEYIEFRTPPERPIISYLDNLSVGQDILGRSTVSFDLGATFSNEALDELNRLLGETGVSTIFVEELKKDRSLISNLLVYEVTRKNNKTGSTIVWPLVKEGRFIDDAESRLKAKSGEGRASDAGINAGSVYTYTARLLIINPERFFKEALTRIPASTQQIISNTNPNFVQVSAAKFAENFAIQPGTILSPTTLEKGLDFRTELQGAFTGISYKQTVSIPFLKASPKNVKVHRNVSGRPANVIKWDVDGSIETVFSFQIDVTLGRENTVPLRSVSPVVAGNGKYEVRDEVFVNDVAPVSYRVSAIYSDMSKSQPVASNEVYSGASMPVKILDSALKRQLSNIVGVDLASVKPNTLDSRLLQASSVNPLKSGGTVGTGINNNSSAYQVETFRNTLASPASIDKINSLNPSRRIRK